MFHRILNIHVNYLQNSTVVLSYLHFFRIFDVFFSVFFQSAAKIEPVDLLSVFDAEVDQYV